MQDRHRKDAAGRVYGVEDELLQATHGARAHVRAGRGGDAVAHAEAGLPVSLRPPPSPRCLCLQHPCPDGSPGMQRTLLTCECASVQATLERIQRCASCPSPHSWQLELPHSSWYIPMPGVHPGIARLDQSWAERTALHRASTSDAKIGRIVSKAHRLAQALAFRHDISAAAPLNPTPMSCPCTILLTLCRRMPGRCWDMEHVCVLARPRHTPSRC